MPFALSYVLVLYHNILEHRIRFCKFQFQGGVWRCLKIVETDNWVLCFFNTINFREPGTHSGIEELYDDKK